MVVENVVDVVEDDDVVDVRLLSSNELDPDVGTTSLVTSVSIAIKFNSLIAVGAVGFGCS